MQTAIQDVDLKLLRIFQTVARSGGFSAAQDELNTSQSTISTSMAQLEQRLGMRLCERGVKGFRLTEQGELVLRAAERLFASMEDFRSDVSEAEGRLTGELRIGFVDNVTTNENFKVPEVIDQLAQQSEELTFSIYVGAPQDLEARVLDGRLHSAIGLFHRRVPQLTYETIFLEEHELYCGNQHPFFDKADKNISDEDLTSANYVGREYLETMEALRPPMRLNVVASSRYMEGLANFVLSGRYIAYLPTHYAAAWVESGRMRSLRPKEFTRSAKIQCVYKKRSAKSLSQKAFLRAVKEAHRSSS